VGAIRNWMLQRHEWSPAYDKADFEPTYAMKQISNQFIIRRYQHNFFFFFVAYIIWYFGT
jgi:hypothetical protein